MLGSSLYTLTFLSPVDELQYLTRLSHSVLPTIRILARCSEPFLGRWSFAPVSKHPEGTNENLACAKHESFVFTHLKMEIVDMLL